MPNLAFHRVSEEILEPEDVPLCPMCDMIIFEHELSLAVIVSSGGVLCLAHEHCVEEAKYGEVSP